MPNIMDFKPDWTNRRKVIKKMLLLLSILLVASLIGATVLAYFAKFGLYISLFYTVFAALSFLVILGIVGSYVFGARWETKDFLNVLPDIVPDFNLSKQKDLPDADVTDEPSDVPPES